MMPATDHIAVDVYRTKLEIFQNSEIIRHI